MSHQGQMSSHFCLQYLSINYNCSNESLAKAAPGAGESNAFVSVQGLNVKLNVLREKYAEPLMDVLIFSGQHGLTLATHCHNLFKRLLASINGQLHQFFDFHSQRCILLLKQYLLYIRAQS
jgi:hypothetical protein